jgi:hypothetical protein
MSENIAQLVANIRLTGATLVLDGERVLYTPPKGLASDAKRAALDALRGRRDEIVAYLVVEATPTRESVLAACGAEYCAGCYEVGHNLHVHPPKGRTL